METDLLYNVGLCIVAGTLLAYLARFVRQPLLVGYIAAGVIVGPIGLNWVKAGSRHEIEQLAELGLAFLMFIVGLEIDFRKLLSTGGKASIVTSIQVAGCALLGWAAGLALGYRGLEAAYVGVVLAFSSTMIVVKLLSDRSELDTLAGRVTLGVLLLQDVCAIVVLAIQPNLTAASGAAAGTSPALMMATAAGKGLLLVAGAILISRYLLPLAFRWVSNLPEVLLLSAITWCFVVCYAAIVLGFSSAMGALIAGVSISAYPYTLDVVAKIRSLRDFFVTLFFVSLGMLLTVPSGRVLLAVALLAVAVPITRLLTVWPSVRSVGFDNRTGVLSAIHLSQISEFSLVVVLLGGPAGFGHVGEDFVSMAVVLMVVTSTATMYLVQHGHRLTSWVVGALDRTPVLGDTRSVHGTDQEPQPAEVMLVGCFRIGSSLIHELGRAGHDFSVIDFNPELRDQLEQLGVRCMYGDISHLDTLQHAGVDRARVIIAPVPDDFLRGTDSLKLLANFRRLNPTARIVLVTESLAQARRLYEEGADYVLVPRISSARAIMDAVARVESPDFPVWRTAAIAELNERRETVP